MPQRIARAGADKRVGKGASKEVRPTSGKVLLALLNILGASGRVEGARVLDLFSGTGGVSLGMLERGAASALAVESERERASAVSGVFARRGYAEIARCLCADVRRALPQLVREGERFDVVFADPPYSLGWGGRLVALMSENWEVLADGGVFVFEHASREELPPLECQGGVIGREDRIYGDTVLSFYRSGGREV